jgi:hypothetical protein
VLFTGQEGKGFALVSSHERHIITASTRFVDIGSLARQQSSPLCNFGCSHYLHTAIRTSCTGAGADDTNFSVCDTVNQRFKRKVCV